MSTVFNFHLNTGPRSARHLARNTLYYMGIAGLGIILLLSLSTCIGIPTLGERAARDQASTISSKFRPQGKKPALATLTATSSLGDFLEYAMLNQPKVEAAYYDWMASIERITTSRSLPDPQLTFQTDIESVVTSVMPGLMMNFPAAGRLGAAAEIASAESQTKFWAFQSAVLQSAYSVKRSYFQLYFLSEKIRVNRENLKLLTELEQLAKAQNQVAKGTLQDVLRAQIEKDRLKNDIANLEDSRTPLLAELKAALGLGLQAEAPPIPAHFESTGLDLTSEQLLVTALEQNTSLKALQAEVQAAQAAITMANATKMPDTSFGLMADVKMSPALYRPLASISLPIWRDKIAAQIAEAEANKLAAQARLSDEQIALVADFTARSYLFREASRNLVLLKEHLLPKARQSLEIARSAYLSGQIDFFNLADTERSLLGFDLDRVEAATQREILLAELSLIIQGMSPMAGSAGSAGMSSKSISTTDRGQNKNTTMR